MSAVNILLLKTLKDLGIPMDELMKSCLTIQGFNQGGQRTLGNIRLSMLMDEFRSEAFISAIIPQVLPFYLSNCLFNFEGNVRYAAVLGYVGAGGIGLILNEKISWREYPSVGMILVALFVTVFIIESVSRTLRKKLV